MSQNLNIARVVVVLLFALTFTMMGWAAPVLYASYAPVDSIIEVHDYEAQDTTTESTYHYICFDRTINQKTPASIISELYLVNDEGERILLKSSENDRYFRHGRDTVITSQELPENLKTGQYRYIAVVNLDMANGRVERTASFESEKFRVIDGPKLNATRPDGC